CLAALRLLNGALAEAGEDRVCLRAGKPSLPQWFLRAGLRELQRQERAEVDDGKPVTHRGAGPERTGGAECSARARPEAAPGATEVILAELPSRASRVRGILRRGPATVDEIAKAAGVGRNEAHNTIGG